VKFFAAYRGCLNLARKGRATAFSDNLMYRMAIHRVRMQENMSPKSAKSERRRKSRKSPPSLVYVELGTENGGMLKDLSEEGFALRTMMPVRPGYKTAFSIVLNASLKIEGQGEVLWIEENGRVAGLRFVEISPDALPQIQGWLKGTLEKPAPGQEAQPEEPASPPAQTFDQLRQELHSCSPTVEAPRSETRTQALPPQEEATAEPSAAPETPPSEDLPVALRESIAPSEEAKTPEAVAELTPAVESFPGLPDFSSTLQAIEITFDAIPPAPGPVPERFPRLKPFARSESTPVAEQGEEMHTSAGLPEISKILIQPPGVEREFAIKSSTLDALDAPVEGHAQPQAKWMEWFTLPRVVMIMTLLMLLVTFSVFHRVLGNGFIWLGEAMGGGQSGQSAAPIPAEEISNSGGSNVSETSPELTNSPARSGQSAPSSTSQRESTSNPPPALTRNAKAPSTGIGSSSVLGGSAPPPETGLPEYSKALQLLHGKKSSADTSEAVRLLWDSVGKGNTSAELTLAELYWHGEGIEHNCDQTRNLLSVAASKGNVDAQKMLKKFQLEGCQ